jgi:hypothetical protein
MDSALQNVESRRPDLTTVARPQDSADLAPQPATQASAELLVPHLVAATFILGAITLTPAVLWKMTTVMPVILQATVTSIFAAVSVCGLISYGIIWWLCERSSRAYHHAVLKAARRSARFEKRRTHAA